MKTYPANDLDIVQQLVETRINGNSIKGNKTYERMLKRITKDSINNYNRYFVGHTKELFGSKLEMIEQIRDSEVYR